ncbi:MAG: glycoside hydrolase family 44 protein [Anaerolineales bacterium]|nr:glycoside hydrolase family 44 protein [Anaerolineales bacterium]
MHKMRWAVAMVLMGLLLAPLGVSRPAQAAVDRVLYADALGSGVQNWSWDTTVNLANTSPVQAGSNAIAVTYTAAWGGLYLHLDTPQSTTGYDRFRFYVRGGSTTAHLRFQVNGTQSGGTITAPPGGWTLVEASLASVGSPATVADLYWQDSTGAAQPTFYIDSITLVASTGSPTNTPLPSVTPTASGGPALSVNVTADRATISPWIYGLNYPDPGLAEDLALPVARWGGNSTTRYNWQLDVYNTGSDWFFENITNPVANVNALPAGSAADQFVLANQAAGSDTLLTVPLIGWVAKRRVGSHPYDCGFKVSVYGAQGSTDPWDSDCGNGVTPGGADIAGNNPTDTSVAITSTFVRDWILHLKSTFGSAAAGGVRFYNLDNEPMLWNSTHRDIHPAATTYDEMATRTIDVAAAVKQADSTAMTLGPVLWGWCAYFYSARDDCGASTQDYTSHGNTYFVPWYLAQMRAYEQSNGTRLLDFLDLHYYPQAGSVALSSAGNATTQALRLRSTRSLWDPTYIDESWIASMGLDGGVVKLIPRMQTWVDTYYPGTRLAITEYNWGGLEHINGALAQADVLGIFGREGLDLATLWAPPEPNQPGAFAFRMYLNYDGAGSAFGETHVRGVSTNQEQLAVYAAQRSADQAVTVMVINKTAGSLSTTLSLSNFSAASGARVFRYSSANLAGIVRQPDLVITSNNLLLTLPANSITLIELKPGTPLNLTPRVRMPMLAR